MRQIIFVLCIVVYTLPRAAAHPVNPPSPDDATSGSLEAAILFLDDRVALNPDDAIAVSKLGALWLGKAKASASHLDYRRAEQYYRRLFVITPNSKSAPLGLAQALSGRHKFREARRLLETARDTAVDPSLYDIPLGDLYFNLGEYDLAEPIYLRIYNPLNLTLGNSARLSQIAEVRGRYDEAEEYMTEAFEVGKLLNASNGELAWCQTMLGDLALKKNDFAAAREHFQAAFDLAPQTHYAQWKLAIVDLAQQQPQSAIERLTNLVQRYPLPQYEATFGDALIATGDIPGARAVYTTAQDTWLAEFAIGENGHLREFSEFLIAHGGDAETAAKLALQDLRDIRADAGAYETAAAALRAAGHDDEAREILAEAAKRNIHSHRLDRLTNEMALGE